MSNYVRLLSATTIGVEGFIVVVEIDIQNGLPKFEITGLADSTIREAKERVRSAIINSGYNFPIGRIVINLAPADIRKEGTSFDLVIAIGILLSSNQICVTRSEQENINNTTIIQDEFLIAGELSLDGTIRSIKGTLPIVEAAKIYGSNTVYIPADNILEAQLMKGVKAVGVPNLSTLVSILEGNEPVSIDMSTSKVEIATEHNGDYSDVIGQGHAKRGILLAAAGSHHILMVGPPGTGKSMLAKRMPTILPPLGDDEALEVRKIQSISGLLLRNDILCSVRPFRSPHHSITSTGLVGGMHPPKPGEISLAHHGVLFLDELTEFSKRDLEVLRQPLEDGEIVIVRGGVSIRYPAEFLLIGALNPCQCGYYLSKTKGCTCKEWERKRYINKISGPFRDRFDLQLEVREVDIDEFTLKGNNFNQLNELKKVKQSNKKQKSDVQLLNANELSSADMKEIVLKARERQHKRQGKLNSKLNSKEIEVHINMDETAKVFIKKSYKQMGLSMRGYHKVLKVARTIADIEGVDHVSSNHIAETLTYRSMEKYY